MRETLTEWPTEPLQDAVEWWMYYAAPDFEGIPGRFRYDDLGRIVFECEDGMALGASTFEEGERFEPCDGSDADRIASLEAELTTLRAQLAAPLRLGRGPTGDEVKQHGVGVGLWLVHFAGDAPDRWHVVCFRAIDDEDARPTDFEIDEVGWTDIAVDYDDAIPLDSNRQPCPVGGGRGTL